MGTLGTRLDIGQDFLFIVFNLSEIGRNGGTLLTSVTKYWE